MPPNTTMVGLGTSITAQYQVARDEQWKTQVVPYKRVALTEKVKTSTEALEAVAPSEQTESYRGILEANIKSHQDQLNKLQAELQAREVRINEYKQMDQNAQSLLGGGG
jgi:hypothetical protein